LSKILEKKETHQTEINHKESNQELLHVNKVPTTSKIVKLPEAINSQNSKSYYSISENNLIDENNISSSDSNCNIYYN
jgi:hypothetical protein